MFLSSVDDADGGVVVVVVVKERVCAGKGVRQ